MLLTDLLEQHGHGRCSQTSPRIVKPRRQFQEEGRALQLLL